VKITKDGKTEERKIRKNQEEKWQEKVNDGGPLLRRGGRKRGVGKKRGAFLITQGKW